MANGSRRRAPTVPSAAAVCSDETVAPMKTPCCQSNDSLTSGTLVARLPPNRMASIGTPAGSSQLSAIDGHWLAGAVNRLLGCEDGSGDAGVQSLPFQSTRWAGGSSVSPSHQMSPSSVRATLVKMQLAYSVATAFALVF